MVCVGIDVAKDKHDCVIINSEGEILADVFTISNNMAGFKQLHQAIQRCTCKTDKIKVGLEATGHYSYNICKQSSKMHTFSPANAHFFTASF